MPSLRRKWYKSDDYLMQYLKINNRLVLYGKRGKHGRIIQEYICNTWK